LSVPLLQVTVTEPVESWTASEIAVPAPWASAPTLCVQVCPETVQFTACAPQCALQAVPLSTHAPLVQVAVAVPT